MEAYSGETRVDPEDFWTRQGFITQDLGVIKMLHYLRRAAERDYPVLIYGESGTGKELAAHMVHERSSRSRQAFITMDCTTIQEALAENEFFGHEIGAYTGAGRAAKGLFELADKGTLFMDEISNLPLNIQSKLLRVIEYGKFRRLGGREEVDVDVRVIAATNVDLQQEVAKRRFRMDLYFRLNITPVHISPLRHRNDLLLLTDYFLQEENARHQQNKTISEDGYEAILYHQWRGNVRELQNAIRKAHCMNQEDVIGPEDLALSQCTICPSSLSPGQIIDELRGGKEYLSFDEIKTRYARQVIAECNGNITQAARFLGVHRNTLLPYRRKK